MIEFEDNICFGCGKKNKHGLKLKFKFDANTHNISSDYVVSENFEGTPKAIHAGIIGTILDETMITVNKYLEFITLTSELSVRYLLPARINETLTIKGWHVKKNKQVIENRAEIRNEVGEIVAKAKGKYIKITELPRPD
jgi:acyl-coenzyme A thioesterase PaaI-like protein